MSKAPRGTRLTTGTVTPAANKSPTCRYWQRVHRFHWCPLLVGNRLPTLSQSLLCTLIPQLRLNLDFPSDRTPPHRRPLLEDIHLIHRHLHHVRQSQRHLNRKPANSSSASSKTSPAARPAPRRLRRDLCAPTPTPSHPRALSLTRMLQASCSADKVPQPNLRNQHGPQQAFLSWAKRTEAPSLSHETHTCPPPEEDALLPADHLGQLPLFAAHDDRVPQLQGICALPAGAWPVAGRSDTLTPVHWRSIWQNKPLTMNFQTHLLRMRGKANTVGRCQGTEARTKESRRHAYGT